MHRARPSGVHCSRPGIKGKASSKRLNSDKLTSAMKRQTDTVRKGCRNVEALNSNTQGQLKFGNAAEVSKTRPPPATK
jgi:hypothetical protein